MSNFIKVEKPEIQEPINWNKFMQKLIGFDEWCQINKNKIKQKYGRNNK